MSLTSEQRLVQFTLTGSGQVLVVPFKFFTSADLKVTKTVGGVDTLLVITTDYSVAGGGIPAATGSVTMVAGVAGDIITVEGATTETQPNDLSTGGAPSYAVLTAMVDRVTILAQQLSLQVSRSLRVPNTNGVVGEMALAVRAGKFVGFDAAGNLILSTSTAGATSDPIRLDLTSFTGGTATCLDSLATATLVLNSILTIQPGGPGNALVRVQLITSTAIPIAGVIIRPVDYNAVTNPRQWYVVG